MSYLRSTFAVLGEGKNLEKIPAMNRMPPQTRPIMARKEKEREI